MTKDRTAAVAVGDRSENTEPILADELDDPAWHVFRLSAMDSVADYLATLELLA
ncbi:MAG: hypothetical protein ACRDOU_00255 [Streptosporangiaceae bacterium]